MEAKIQIQRALRHVATRFPEGSEPVLTDISIRVFPHSGELRFYDDDENELMRIVIPEWIHGSRDEAFYKKVSPVISDAIGCVRKEVLDHMSLMRPFSFVLQDEDGETIDADLYIVDDEETVVLSGGLLDGLDKDLDSFLDYLMKE